MSNLKVTPAMVRELAEWEAMAPAIVLGPNGWDFEACPDGLPGGRVALTQSDIEAWLDGGDLTDDDAAALAAGPNDDHFTIPTDGPEKDGDWEIVFPAEIDGDEAWRECYAIDLSTATKAIDVPSLSERDGDNEWSALWVTEDGTWIRECFSNWMNSMGRWLEEVDADTVAAETYALADEDRVAEDAPALIESARAARLLVSLCAAPSIPEGTDDVRMPGAIARIAEDAEAAVDRARVILELLRNRVTADLRNERSRSASIIVRDEDGNVSAAARRLGIAQPTLHGLLN